MLAKCESILRVFREGKDPYLDFAVSLYEQSYEVLYAEWKAGDSTKRTNSKPASLGCSYRLSGGKEEINTDGDKVWTGLMGYARSMGVEMSQEDAAKSVAVFRKKFPEVVQLWYDMENAAAYSIRHSGKMVGVGKKDPIIFFKTTGESMLEMVLPSGRSLHYIKPEVRETTQEGRNGPYKKDEISYEGREQGGTRQWGRIPTHGGKLVENCTQAVARDILVEGMHNAERAGFEVVGHVHDELITLVDDDSPLTDKELCECLTTQPKWIATPLPLKAEGYTGVHYRK
jgi:DNA polymerase